MTDIIGTKSEDGLHGTGQGDYINAGAGDDQAWGNGGSDFILGGSGDDHLFGDSAANPEVPLLQIAEDYQVSVTFDYEGAGYRNSFGVYKVDGETGAIKDVSMVWENASLKGSGGDLIGGVSKQMIDVEAGDQLGFFLIANGFSRNDFAGMDGGQFEFRNADGSVATLESDAPHLYHVSDDGSATRVKSNIYHSAGHGDHVGLNPDDMIHTVGMAASDDGKIQLGFEDLYNGGDRDFDDAVFTVDIGSANARVLNAHFHARLEDAVGEAREHLRPESESAAHDKLMGGKGADYIDGMEGNDLLAGGGVGKEWQQFDGKWVYVGLSAHESNGKGGGGPVDNSDDIIIGGEGDDVLIGGGGDDVMNGSTGNDIVNGGNGNDMMLGGAGADTLNGDNGKDEIGGGEGDDLLNGGKDDDQLFGEAGNDTLNGGHGKDYLVGGDGADTLNGGDGKDKLLGDAGDDKLNGHDGDDVLYGGAGNDALNGNDGHDELSGGEGDDLMSGGEGHDTLVGEEGNDKLYAGSGNDTASGGDGADKLVGGDGHDVLFGDSGADELHGGSDKDSLSGGDGADKLVGGTGKDVIEGGAGNDHLWGGNWSGDNASDVFVFGKDSGVDWIHDFELDHDMIDLKAFEVDWESVKNSMSNNYGNLFIDIAAIGGGAGDGFYVKGVDEGKMTEDSFII